MSRSSFPWILRHQPQEELPGIPSFLSGIILTFQRCFLLARFKNRLASLASAWAVKASREIFTKYFPGFVWFCYQVIHSLAKRLIQIRDVTQRVKFINVFLCNKDLFYYKSHISLPPLPLKAVGPTTPFIWVSQLKGCCVRSLQLCRKMPKN